jgi:hypothetical protein
VESIITYIPKAHSFRSENFWMLHDEFMEVLQLGWDSPILYHDKAKNITAKFKNLRKTFRQWKQQQQLPCLAKTIEQIKMVLSFLNTMEEFRDLSLEEWNFRENLLTHIENLLE